MTRTWKLAELLAHYQAKHDAVGLGGQAVPKYHGGRHGFYDTEDKLWHWYYVRRNSTDYVFSMTTQWAY